MASTETIAGIVTAICGGIAAIIGAIATLWKKINKDKKNWKEVISNIHSEDLKTISHIVEEQIHLVKEALHAKDPDKLRTELLENHAKEKEIKNL